MYVKFYTIFNYLTIGIVAVFLVLILTETVPRETYITLLILTIMILVARIAARVYLNLYLKKNSKGE